MFATMQPARASRPALPGTATRVTPVRAVKDVFMPALSSTMTEGKVVSWLKSEGDAVSKGEALVVVESDKADMDVECFEDGFLGSIVIEEGGTANVGAPIAYIAESEAEIADAKAKGGASSNGTAPPSAKEEAPKVCRLRMFACRIQLYSRCCAAVKPSSQRSSGPQRRAVDSEPVTAPDCSKAKNKKVATAIACMRPRFWSVLVAMRYCSHVPC
jgi:pyruvate/2-oxoglutarate dehydrogenase complex dihydrolipoamide acyltransferase (E2) component